MGAPQIPRVLPFFAPEKQYPIVHGVLGAAVGQCIADMLDRLPPAYTPKVNDQMRAILPPRL